MFPQLSCSAHSFFFECKGRSVLQQDSQTLTDFPCCILATNRRQSLFSWNWVWVCFATISLLYLHLYFLLFDAWRHLTLTTFSFSKQVSCIKHMLETFVAVWCSNPSLLLMCKNSKVKAGSLVFRLFICLRSCFIMLSFLLDAGIVSN